MPEASPDSLTDRWRRGTLTVEARYDTLGDRATLVVIDTLQRHDWRLTSVPAPAHRLYWIDAPADSLVRQALGRAFDEAALYSEEARTVWIPVPPRRAATPVRLASLPVVVRQGRTSRPRLAVPSRHSILP